MAQFYTLLTQVGQAKLANAVALGNTLELTHLAVGDGGGSVPTPDSDRTSLINEVRRAPINRVEVDADNPNWVVVEQVVPPDVGGWTIREIGVFDSAGDLIAYGNYPETYKPTLDEGSGRTQTVRMVLQVSDTAAVTLKVDPSVVLATRKYVDDGDAAVAQAAAQALENHVEADSAHAANQIALEEPVGQVPEAETVQQALAALGAFAGDGYQNMVVLDTPGITEWEVPEILKAGLRRAYVTVIGGGGGGGKRDPGGGGGGGAGGAAIGMVDLSGIASITITVGEGGVGASSNGASGENGSTSSFGSLMSATGGGGGRGSSYVPGGGGEGTGGALNFRRQDGQGAHGYLTGGDNLNYSGGTGGSSLLATGGQGTASEVTADAIYGAGGGGTRSADRAMHGGDGIVIVRW